jgi:hypothetical protein
MKRLQLHKLQNPTAEEWERKKDEGPALLTGTFLDLKRKKEKETIEEKLNSFSRDNLRMEGNDQMAVIGIFERKEWNGEGVLQDL